jgi:hypothetical protein
MDVNVVALTESGLAVDFLNSVKLNLVWIFLQEKRI